MFRFDDDNRVNVSSPPVECSSCGGDRFRALYTRPVRPSQWMRVRGIAPAEDASVEEYAPCPDCHAELDASFRRFDGSWARTPDPAKVRQALGYEHFS